MALHYIIVFLIFLKLIVNYFKYNTPQQKDDGLITVKDYNQQDEKQKTSRTKFVQQQDDSLKLQEEHDEEYYITNNNGNFTAN
jgi:hypothetical protein